MLFILIVPPLYETLDIAFLLAFGFITFIKFTIILHELDN
jgi:hypothetical protein